MAKDRICSRCSLIEALNQVLQAEMTGFPRALCEHTGSPNS